MKYLVLVTTLLLVSCSNEPKESDKLLVEYKKQQLDKAKKVEQEMNKRLDNIDQQLKELEEEKKDDPQ